MRWRLALFFAVTVLVVSRQSFAQGQTGQSSANTSTETGTSSSVEGSQSKRESETQSTEKGGNISRSLQKGVRESTRRELTKALEKLQNRSLQRSLNIVGIYAQAAAQHGLIRKMYIDDVLIVPLGNNMTYRSNLQSIANNNSVIGVDLIDTMALKRQMAKLYQMGNWISNSLKNARLADGIGLNDWREIAELSARYDVVGQQQAYSQQIVSDLAGECRFNGQYTRIECGNCVIDLSNKAGMNELVCNGLGMFSPDSAGGERIVLQGSESFSLRDAASLSKSDEAFRAVTHTMDEYMRWSASHSKAVEAAAAKKKTLSMATKNSKSVVAPIQGMQEKEDPMQILGNLGIR